MCTHVLGDQKQILRNKETFCEKKQQNSNRIESVTWDEFFSLFFAIKEEEKYENIAKGL